MSGFFFHKWLASDREMSSSAQLCTYLQQRLKREARNPLLGTGQIWPEAGGGRGGILPHSYVLYLTAVHRCSCQSPALLSLPPLTRLTDLNMSTLFLTRTWARLETSTKLHENLCLQIWCPGSQSQNKDGKRNVIIRFSHSRMMQTLTVIIRLSEHYHSESTERNVIISFSHRRAMQTLMVIIRLSEHHHSESTGNKMPEKKQHSPTLEENHWRARGVITKLCIAAADHCCVEMAEVSMWKNHDYREENGSWWLSSASLWNTCR